MIVRDARGATAVEFAMIFPLMLLLMLGSVSLGFAIWTENIVQAAAQDAARCIALQLAPCATVPAGCDSGSAAVCYVETAAQRRGITKLTSQQVAINANALISGASFTSVTISYSFALSTYVPVGPNAYTIVGSGSFPN